MIAVNYPAIYQMSSNVLVLICIYDWYLGDGSPHQQPCDTHEHDVIAGWTDFCKTIGTILILFLSFQSNHAYSAVQFFFYVIRYLESFSYTNVLYNLWHDCGFSKEIAVFNSKVVSRWNYSQWIYWTDIFVKRFPLEGLDRESHLDGTRWDWRKNDDEASKGER